MTSKCSYCEIPNRDLSVNDYFDKMSLWRKYVSEGAMKFLDGDTPLENFEEEISKEEKYVYYHHFKCNCGKVIRAGVCIRSSVPILEHINLYQQKEHKIKTLYNNSFNSFWQQIKAKFKL